MALPHAFYPTADNVTEIEGKPFSPSTVTGRNMASFFLIKLRTTL